MRFVFAAVLCMTPFAAMAQTAHAPAPPAMTPDQMRSVIMLLNDEKSAVENRVIQLNAALEAMTARAEAAEKERDALKAKEPPIGK